MKLYRCELCGRVFNQKISHKCSGGCYRKHRIPFTEFEDVDNEYCKCTGCCSTDLEETIYKLDGSNIDWEERRYEIAKTVFPKMLEWITARGTVVQDAIVDNRAARNAVLFADALIVELKKKGE